MRVTQDDLFDAKLRALLSDPMPAAKRMAPTMPPVLTRSDAALSPVSHTRLVAGLTIAAAVLILAGLWFLDTRGSGEGSPLNSDSGVATGPEDERLDASQDKKQDKQRNPTPNAAEFNTWLQQLSDPAKRETATVGFTRGGRLGAAFLADWLAFQAPDELDSKVPLVLRALERMGREAAREIPVLLKLLDRWPAERISPVVHTIGTLAAWRFTKIRSGKISANRFELNGRTRTLADISIAGKLVHEFTRLSARAKVGADTKLRDLVKHLAGSAFRREAALDVLLDRIALAPDVALAVESILLRDQPTIKHVEWIDAQRVRDKDISMTDVLRTKAATLLARRPMANHAASAHAWQLGRAEIDTRTRRRAALALGHILSRNENRTEPRLRNAIDALLAAANGEDFAIAGDAVTALGQIGTGQLGEREARITTTLQRLTKHKDASLAQRAVAALASVRGSRASKK